MKAPDTDTCGESAIEVDAERPTEANSDSATEIATQTEVDADAAAPAEAAGEKSEPAMAETAAPAESEVAAELAPTEAAETVEPDEAETDFFAQLAEPLRRALEGRGYRQATAVQRAVLESEVQGRDVQISSQTGSGKTVALGMLMAPVLLNDEEYHGGTQAMIIAPTRASS